ncbi:hypothetical protein MBLNU230_g6402t1 [Neophaeotheca triangularis]
MEEFEKPCCQNAPKSSVIVPLYQYPKTSQTWQPLHEAITSNPHLQFVVVLNPNSGPGERPWWPNEDYVREIPKLNEQPNVLTLGYVRTEYCKRDLQETCRDIQTYGTWSQDEETPGCYVQGIFFDETPNEASDHCAGFLEVVTWEARNASGIQGPRLVIHNPGTPPDPALSSSQPDVTAVFEESHGRYRSCNAEEKRAIEHHDRAHSCIIVHSVPNDRLPRMVHELRHRAQYLFLTDARYEYYERFGSSWQAFVQAMAA